MGNVIPKLIELTEFDRSAPTRYESYPKEEEPKRPVLISPTSIASVQSDHRGYNNTVSIVTMKETCDESNIVYKVYEDVSTIKKLIEDAYMSEEERMLLNSANSLKELENLKRG